MMKRVFYLAVGVGVGVVVARRVMRAADRLTPGGLADQARRSGAGVAAAIRGFIDDVRAAMAEREAELQEALTDEGPVSEDRWSPRK
ncbi:putative secreted protein [Acidothermus cellulolyticus 11B]|jgi:cysteine sulfinate desulfinase/cysteine desulfurase-like protein|uniref:Putative secreted protein n=1 Tax=Acidothermus cellulolyticus (strain ATCC 43068 / DSM 8971 / 11B) TaxID=351607 RepID=A0LUJ3_ACIC1|nr:DUF6167 family protein [Acidothermus cellulolyticus]ABK53103.1 putative secreted protein [Acidothermus cellulolyticus 11B]MBX6372451.1 hypothetical protein [Acidothermus sp.]MCL6551405.1 DUF6167 family protein [Acidothermus cellulolyticus]